MEISHNVPTVNFEAVDKILDELNEIIQTLNVKFNKDTESLKRCQTKILKVKSCIEFIHCRNDQYEHRVSGTKDKIVNYNEDIKENQKIIEDYPAATR